MLTNEIYEFGTDIKSNWEFTEHGDLQIVQNDENIKQAILNRLNTKLDGLGLYYEEYGSLLQNLLGYPINEETLEFIRIEIETSLNKDPRLNNYEVNVTEKDGEININIFIWYNGEELEYNLVITGDEIEDLNQTEEDEEEE